MSDARSSFHHPSRGAGEALEPVDLRPVADRVVLELGAAPGAAVGAAIRRAGRWRYGLGAAGRLELGAQAPPTTPRTVFDLASLTKPLVALALARLERAGRIGRSEQLGRLLPSLEATPSARVSLDQLAAHRGGLEAHRELFVPRAHAAQLDRQGVLLAAATARRAGCTGVPPRAGFAPEYSDLGYLLLGAALESTTGRQLDALVRELVGQPLGLGIGSARQLAQELGGRSALRVQVAATERVPWRGGVLRGVVHDENAWIFAGEGLAGHAGAFGDVRAVLRWGVGILDSLAGRRDEWLTAAELAPVIRRRSGGTLCGGFDRRSGAQSTSGQRFGPETFGHLGFTGTSLWMDPERELVGVLLTNRVHPSRRSTAIRAARPAAYDELFERMIGG